MVHESWLGVEFFALVSRWDAAIAQQVAVAGCSWCGGPLHRGNYLRKPRGGLLASAGESSRLRHSLCCGRRGCRRRALPPSLRFLGRRVYVEAVVVLGSVFAQLALSLREARAATGVPGRTLRRWGTWWRGSFPTLGVWAELRARFVPPPPEESELPRSLVARLGDDLGSARPSGAAPTLTEVMLLVARCLAPVTTSSVPDAARFTREAAPLSAGS
jgi:hypothetical protein